MRLRMSTGIKTLLVILGLVIAVYGISFISENTDLVLITLLDWVNRCINLFG